MAVEQHAVGGVRLDALGHCGRDDDGVALFAILPGRPQDFDVHPELSAVRRDPARRLVDPGLKRRVGADAGDAEE